MFRLCLQKWISPFIEKELTAAKLARSSGDARLEFYQLERAHVMGQGSTYWHVQIHVLMLLWGIRNRSGKEVLGQIFRILGAGTMTVFGWVPQGNTGGCNVSPFKKMAMTRS